DSIVEHILRQQQTRQRRDKDPIDSMMDGTAFSDRVHGKLKIELYLDDCQLAPANFAGSKQKHLLVYITFADIPILHRTKMRDIETLIIVNRDKLKVLGDQALTKLFERLIKDLHELPEFNFELSNGQTSKIEVAISSIIGDNLQVNEILGFKQSFNDNSFTCRYCASKARGS